MKKSTFLIFVMLSFFTNAHFTRAQVAGESPPFALSISQLKDWTKTGSTASAANVAAVPLAARFTQADTQINPNLSSSIKVLSSPDGINNKGNYTSEQGKFNLFNFTHWQYIDILNWFGGTADLSIMLPSAPWVNAAHKNGVKVIGSVFFAPGAYGGNTSKLYEFLEQDSQGNFVCADKLIEIAEYYRFDGWLMNQETSANQDIANKMRAFLKYFNSRKPAGMEIIWYDSMVESGPVSWQNELNTSNDAFLQDGNQRTSDGMFTNYNWGSGGVNTSVSRAKALGRSPFEVYMGADVWPDRGAQPAFRNVSWIDKLFANGNVSQPKTSIALFATNFIFDKINNFSSDPNAVDDFYDTEVRFFAGNDRDPDAQDASGQWKGIANYVPAKSVIRSLPFETSFNTGHGKVFAKDGSQAVKAWHDMSKQDILPTWQFWISGNSVLKAKYDFDAAYSGGSSLKVAGVLKNSSATRIKLFKTKLAVANNTKVDLAFRSGKAGATNAKLIVSFAGSPNNFTSFEIGNSPSGGWNTKTIDLSAHQGKEIAIVGFEFSSTVQLSDFSFSVGKIKVFNGNSTISQKPAANFTSNKTTIEAGQSIQFTNTSVNASGFTWTFEGGSPATSALENPLVAYPKVGTYSVTLQVQNEEGSDVETKTGYIQVNPVGSTPVDHTDPVGTGTITVRKSINAAENGQKVFDNKAGTKWLDNGGAPSTSNPSWAQIQLPASKTVNNLVLTSANDADERDPQNFVLKGSNDGSNYTVLHTVTNAQFINRHQRKSWDFSNTNAYSYYRLEVTKNKGNSGMTQIAEIELFGPSSAEADKAPVAGFAASATSVAEGQSVQFTDQSANNPTSWAWTFEGANSTSSTAQNPAVVYAKAGTYSVSLTASNAAGSNTITKSAYITVTASSASVDHTDPVGTGTITARAQIHLGEGKDKAFDNKSSTKWLDNGGVPSSSNPSWIQIEFASAKVVNILAITSANDDHGRDPKDFRLKGSNDNSNFTTLKTWSGQSFTGRFQRKEWEFSNTAAYRCYRLEIIKNDQNVDMTQLSEIQLIGPSAASSARTMNVSAETEEAAAEKGIDVYPTTVDSELHVDLGAAPDYDRVQILDLSGNSCLEAVLKEKHTVLNIAGLTSGYYIVRIAANNETKAIRFRKK